MDELKHLNENIKIKLDVSLSECDDLNRKLQEYRKRDQEAEKLRKLVDSLQDANNKLQRGQSELESNLELHKSSNTDLRNVIKRLDSELRREKSHLQLLGNNKVNKDRGNFNDQSLFDGLGGLMDDDDFFKEDDKANLVQTAKQRNRSCTKQPGKAQKTDLTSYEDITAGNAKQNQVLKQIASEPVIALRKDTEQVKMSQPLIMVDKAVEQLQKEMKQRDEDIKAMLEIQCLVIEDLLQKQRVFTTTKPVTDTHSQLSGVNTPNRNQLPYYQHQEETPEFEEKKGKKSTLIGSGVFKQARQQNRASSLQPPVMRQQSLKK